MINPLKPIFARFGNWMERRFPHRCRQIVIGGKTYMRRFALGGVGPLFFYLHNFPFSDGDRHLHDHPFRCVCFILCGGYQEERGLSKSIRVYHAPAVNILGCNTPHRISLTLQDTWTLVIGWWMRVDWYFGEVINVQQELSTNHHWWRRRKS